MIVSRLLNGRVTASVIAVLLTVLASCSPVCARGNSTLNAISELNEELGNSNVQSLTGPAVGSVRSENTLLWIDTSNADSNVGIGTSNANSRVGFVYGELPDKTPLPAPPSPTTPPDTQPQKTAPQQDTSPPQVDSKGDQVACACGCGIFDVGNINGMAPTNPSGGMVWFRYTSMNQNVNWEGSSKAPGSDNQDKQIKTGFFYAGAQYTLNKDLTVMGEVPFYNRALTTTDNGTVAGPAGSIYTAHLFAIGDAKVMADYTGVSPDMSTGFLLGLKLPTGQFQSPTGPLGGTYFDRDSMPGTGSLDLLMGAYHFGSFTPNNRIPWWVQANYSSAFVTQNAYRPGNELDTGLGMGYNLGAVVGTGMTPELQLLGSFRQPDGGANADPLNSGYSRLVIAPGILFQFDHFMVYGDVEYPLWQRVNAAANVNIEGTSGQLVAPVAYKVQVGYQF